MIQNLKFTCLLLSNHVVSNILFLRISLQNKSKIIISKCLKMLFPPKHVIKLVSVALCLCVFVPPLERRFCFCFLHLLQFPLYCIVFYLLRNYRIQYFLSYINHRKKTLNKRPQNNALQTTQKYLSP